MRGEQGPRLLHVRGRGKEKNGVVMTKRSIQGRDGPESLTCRGLSFFIIIILIKKTLCLSTSCLCGVTFYGEAPQLFSPPNNPARLPLFLGADAHSLLTQHQQRVGERSCWCLACHKYFVNLNPIPTFTSLALSRFVKIAMRRAEVR